MNMTDDIILVVLGRLKGERKRNVFSALEEDENNADEFRKLKNALALSASKKKMPEYQLEQLYVYFKARQGGKEKALRPKRFFNMLKYAAVFILAAGITSLYFVHAPAPESDSEQQVRNTTVVADNGQLSRIILPDSSVVWLNAGTTLTYNTQFAVTNRDLDLRGQAFFEVSKNKDLPFNVFCHDLQVRALGTSFDVSAYPEDKSIRVVLESGKVKMISAGIDDCVRELVPGQLGEYKKNSRQILLKKVNIPEFISWKDGILIFRDEPMSEVIPRLQRRYNIDIEVSFPGIYNSVFTATIKNETLEEIFKSIGYACSVNYRIIRPAFSDERIKVILTTN